MDECTFCKILAGQIPNHTVYEDDRVIAFLDIYPVSQGHLVLISKNHVEQLWDIDNGTYGHLAGIAKKLSLHLREKTNSFRVGMLVEGMEVPHAHINLIPLNEGMKQSLENRKTAEPDHAALEALATRLYLP